jgi:hypothetical protein
MEFIMTKSAKLLKALQSGRSMTVEQIRTKFNIANPRATVSDLNETINNRIVATRTKKNDGTVSYSLKGATTAKKSTR